MPLTLNNTSSYNSLSVAETLRSLVTSSGGLSGDEALRRLETYGPNEVTEKKRNHFLEFMLRFWGPMPWLLELAMILSFILGHALEGYIILALLVLNAIIGQSHASHSQKAMNLLKKRLALRARVLRDNKWVTVEAKNLVYGDIVAVKLGDIVPADIKVMDGNLSVDQSVLTGESLAVAVNPSDVLFSGSVVKRGEVTGVVVNTGPRTYYGRTAELVGTAKPRSHQVEVMMAVVKYMLYLGIVASVLVTAFAVRMNFHFAVVLTFIVIFLLGAVPVALPAVLTIVQSFGARELAKKGALVTRLDSVEDAASIDILCFDKTGTITENALSVAACIPYGDFTKEDVVRMAALASRGGSPDAIDQAVLRHAEHAGVNNDGYRQVSYSPFDPSTRRTEAVAEKDGRRRTVMKGAVRVILSLCHLTDGMAADIEKTIGTYSKKGYRTLAVATTGEEPEKRLMLAGFLILSDPIRHDSAGMIAEARALGIKPLMLTGDSLAIAREISTQAGIGPAIIRMSDIEGLEEDEQARIVNNSDGFAEIYPEDKYTIVKLLQSQGHMVGMTGDGVNDAPALKQAEMGIAVSNSTDVAKAAASVVITEQGVGIIIDAVKTSRQTYQRMLSWVINKVIKVIEFVVLLTIGFFWFHHLILSLLGVSLLVFANDFVTMSLATDRVREAPSPNKWNVRKIMLASLVPALLFVAGDVMVIVAVMKRNHLTPDELRTLVLLILIFTGQFKVLMVRERNHFWSSRPGKWLIIITLVTITVFILVGVYGVIVPPLRPQVVLIPLLFLFLLTILIDFPKTWFFRRFEL